MATSLLLYSIFHIKALLKSSRAKMPDICWGEHWCHVYCHAAFRFSGTPVHRCYHACAYANFHWIMIQNSHAYTHRWLVVTIILLQSLLLAISIHLALRKMENWVMVEMRQPLDLLKMFSKSPSFLTQIRQPIWEMSKLDMLVNNYHVLW